MRKQLAGYQSHRRGGNCAVAKRQLPTPPKSLYKRSMQGKQLHEHREIEHIKSSKMWCEYVQNCSYERAENESVQGQVLGTVQRILEPPRPFLGALKLLGYIQLVPGPPKPRHSSHARRISDHGLWLCRGYVYLHSKTTFSIKRAHAHWM